MRRSNSACDSAAVCRSNIFSKGQLPAGGQSARPRLTVRPRHRQLQTAQPVFASAADYDTNTHVDAWGGPIKDDWAACRRRKSGSSGVEKIARGRGQTVIEIPREHKQPAEMIRSLAIPGFCILCAGAMQGADWPQWRGPNRDGVWPENGVFESFPPGGLEIKWRAPAGYGFSSPVVA